MLSPFHPSVNFCPYALEATLTPRDHTSSSSGLQEAVFLLATSTPEPLTRAFQVPKGHLSSLSVCRFWGVGLGRGPRLCSNRSQVRPGLLVPHLVPHPGAGRTEVSPAPSPCSGLLLGRTPGVQGAPGPSRRAPTTPPAPPAAGTHLGPRLPLGQCWSLIKRCRSHKGPRSPGATCTSGCCLLSEISQGPKAPTSTPRGTGARAWAWARCHQDDTSLEPEDEAG